MKEENNYMTLGCCDVGKLNSSKKNSFQSKMTESNTLIFGTEQIENQHELRFFILVSNGFH